ncbi:MAG: hypothetical protein AVDCRST_MAG33-2546 [uncultured Thermomicrobiales bacterium]|uniref:ABC transporter, substrate-binding protein (Cluster 1, maltose/g3p/polyamine/iron) n=1 Tax=uncultured Thermomicrobiales bacterium TaxID=1645740 RepID=A0A6J4V9K1_9BACT|nr:MAG: hypothetical protein AVDCRST_MAG33-2546 [uncultured Thermomicrobiales bacterium]
MTLRTRSFNRRQALKAGAGAAAVAAAVPYVSYPTRASAQGTTEVRLSTSSNGPELIALENQVAMFEAANPTITVNIESIPDQYPTALTTNLAAGTAADIFFVDSLLFPDLVTRGQLMQLDDFLTASGGGDDFFPNLLQAFQYNGGTFGIPKDWSALAMFYNSEAFTSAGITAPPTTWEELTTTLQTLTDATGVPGFVTAPDLARILPLIFQAGGGVISPDYSEILIGQQPTADALDLIVGYYNDGLATTPADAGANDTAQALGQQAANATYEGNWTYGGFAQNFPDFPLAAAPLPAGPAGQATLAFTVSYSMFAGTQIAEPAWTVINYLTGEGMLSWTTEFGVMPSRSSLTPQWLEAFPERQLFVDAAQYARPWQLGPGGQVFVDTVANNTLQALFAGQIDAAQALTQLQEGAVANIQLQAPGMATPAS